MGLQNDLGRKSEVKVCSFFGNKKYMAYAIPKGINGQPFDVFAHRKQYSWYVDVKHLEDNKFSFPFSRIEPNQITSMKYAKYVAEMDGIFGFVIDWCNDLYFLDFDSFCDFKNQGQKSVKIEFLPRLEELVKCE